MPLSFAAEADAAIPIRLVDKADAKDALATLSGPASGWAEHHGFAGTLGQTCAIPGASGRPDLVLLGTGDAADRERTRFAIGAAIAKLPEAVYAIEAWPDGPLASEIALGYLFSRYRFSRYRNQSAPNARLVAPMHIDGRPARADRDRRGADPRPDQHARRGHGPP